MSFNFFSLDYIYFPVSGIMWVWHKVFGAIMGNDNAWAWVLSVVFLVFTLRAILFKPFMKQMNSQLKMQALQPEMKKLREKYKDDRQRLAEEMMKLNKEAGVNPLASCLPALIQAPVFIGLFHVLRMFKPGWDQVYFFGKTDVQSFVDAKLFGGAPLSSYITMPTNTIGDKVGLLDLGGDRTTVIWVAIPLIILAGIATHLTSRRSVARQAELGTAQANPQANIMNKVMLYLFPLGVVVGGPFFPLAILFYWLSNNTWTFGQLWIAHRMQDRKKAAEALVVEQAKEISSFSKPRPGARPDPKRRVVEPKSVNDTPSDTPAVSDAGPSLSKGASISDNGSPADGSTNGSAGSRPQPGQRPAGQRKKKKR